MKKCTEVVFSDHLEAFTRTVHCGVNRLFDTVRVAYHVKSVVDVNLSSFEKVAKVTETGEDIERGARGK